MFLISRSDGWINGYDLCYKLNETSFSYKVTDCSLTTMALSNKGDKLLVGDEEGKVSLVKLSQSFYVANSKEETDLKILSGIHFQGEFKPWLKKDFDFSFNNKQKEIIDIYNEFFKEKE